MLNLIGSLLPIGEKLVDKLILKAPFSNSISLINGDYNFIEIFMNLSGEYSSHFILSSKIEEKTIEDVTTGQVFTANQAITFGLIDKIGFLEDAIARAVVLADLQEDSVRVIQYKKPQGLFDEILGGASQARSYNSLEMLVEWTTPRAWYLCSWWPVITTSYP